jgi:soluble lytic murein transglycosylase
MGPAGLVLGLVLGFQPGTGPAPGPTDPAALVRLAQEAARAGRIDEARRTYLSAAARAPAAADWLRLRAAGLTADSAGRAALFRTVASPAAGNRIAAVEAQARERVGDLPGAIRWFEAAGRADDVLRLRVRTAATPAARAAVRRELMDLATRRPAAPQADYAATLLTDHFSPLEPGEALPLARQASERGRMARARALYERGLAAPGASARDSLDAARALLRTGRPREALAALARIRGTPADQAAAALEQARARLRLGEPDAARQLLQALVASHPTAAVVPDALLLLGDLAWDNGLVQEARQTFLRARNDHPDHPLAARGALLGALAAWLLQQPADAAREWEQLRRDYPASDAVPAAGYWAGRAREQLGDTVRAREAWAAVAGRDSLSYYAVVSAERLGRPPWAPSPAPDRFIHLPDLDSALARIDALERLGMAAETALERDWLAAQATGSVERMLATSHAFHRTGQPTLAVRLARAALARGAPADARTYRLIYPFPLRDAVQTLAADAGVDPMLVAALARQESLWEPRARSVAGARGLMQLMPATGAALARQLGLAGWHAGRLDEPDLNLRLGTRYLAGTLQRCGGEVICALAGYNAGPGRVARWQARPGGADRDLLVERMAFQETRDYVRIVQRNLSLYRALYGQAPTP